MSGTSLPSNLFVFISVALLSRLSTSVIISRAESENRLPANDEFTAVLESLEQQRDLEIERVVRDKRKKAQREEGREEERSENHRDEEVVDGDWAKMLHGLLAFNKGLDINNTETQCRLDCVNRWLIPKDDSPPMRLCNMLEADWPTKYNLFSRSSCGMWSRIECLPRSPLISNISFFKSLVIGVDAGLYYGCMAWCTPRYNYTKTTHKYTDIFELVETFPGVKVGMKATCASSLRSSSSTRTSARRIEIRLVRDKPITKYPKKDQTGVIESCRSGFRGAFASAIITGQRIEGFDRLELPVIWHTIHASRNSTRRRRFIYVYGGSRQYREYQVKRVCTDFFADVPDRIVECSSQVDLTLHDRYQMIMPRPLSGGDAAVPWSGAILTQSIIVDTGVDVWNAQVERLSNETAYDSAVRHCHGVLTPVISVTHRAECVGVLAKAMRLEEELQSDAERATAREL